MADQPPRTLTHRLGDAVLWLAIVLLGARWVPERTSDGGDFEPLALGLLVAAIVALAVSRYALWVRRGAQQKDES